MTIGLDFYPSEMNQFILNSAYRPRRKVQHWTPEGGCKVTANKERNQLQDYEENTCKNEWTQIIDNREFAFNFYISNPFKKKI